MAPLYFKVQKEQLYLSEDSHCLPDVLKINENATI